MNDQENGINTIDLATDLTTAWLGNPNTRASADEAVQFLGSVHAAIGSLITTPATAAVEEQTDEVPVPAVSARKSLASPDHIISMIDGKAYKTLRRHLAINGLTPDEYRTRYNLKSDYPMVAPSYSETRRSMAIKIGLGRKPGQDAATPKVGKTTPKAK